jgi:BirA family transcriptional regulator, biotin operon repressor / biotin---[acetyl-CoA-carboxylase] ligase
MDQIKIGEVTSTWAKSHQFCTRYSKSIDSTNDIAKKNAFTEDDLENEFILYVTDEQTKGRGRFDRTWSMPAVGSALISSWSFQILKPAKPHLTALAGLALYHAANATWPFLNWSLKAPNDLYIDDKKIAGLLLETVSQGSEHRLIVGLGMNILNAPADIITSTSLLKNLSAKTPLLGEDWILFLERLFFEFSLLIPNADNELNSTQLESLLVALNHFPLLEKKYTTHTEIKSELWR